MGHGIGFLDLSGQRFGRWTVISRAGRTKHKNATWMCQCDCGAHGVVASNQLRRGKSQSCGCLASEAKSIRSKTHGMRRTRTYRIWMNMIQRCTQPTNFSYPRYGGAGITCCERWEKSFADFYSDMGEAPHDKTLDRIDVNRGYEVSNCRWASYTEQNRNKRSNRILALGGKEMCVEDWADETGIRGATIRNRIDVLGWDVERALTVPVKKRSSKVPLYRLGD